MRFLEGSLSNDLTIHTITTDTLLILMYTPVNVLFSSLSHSISACSVNESTSFKLHKQKPSNLT